MIVFPVQCLILFTTFFSFYYSVEVNIPTNLQIYCNNMRVIVCPQPKAHGLYLENKTQP